MQKTGSYVLNTPFQNQRSEGHDFFFGSREKAHHSHTVSIARYGFDGHLYERRLMECQA